jgi:peptidoglycan/LPS O-acetylase OafA/YrhL
MEDNKAPEQNADNNSETIFSGEEFSMQGYDKHIRQARTAIFVAAGVLAINLLILSFTVPDSYEYLWIDISIWGAFIAGFIILGIWTKKKPYTAIISALILYVVFIVLNALVDITTLYKGIILKVIIIVLLIKGLGDARQAQRMQEQMGGK